MVNIFHFYLIGVLFSIIFITMDYFRNPATLVEKSASIYKFGMIITFIILSILSWITVISEIYSLFVIQKKDK